MTAKEKAAELVDKFYPRATSYSSDRKNQKDNAKQCALIAVDEIINSVVITDLTTAENQFKYWEKVKSELEKL
jgi:hypothetical protein